MAWPHRRSDLSTGYRPASRAAVIAGCPAPLTRRRADRGKRRLGIAVSVKGSPFTEYLAGRSASALRQQLRTVAGEQASVAVLGHVRLRPREAELCVGVLAASAVGGGVDPGGIEVLRSGRENRPSRAAS